MMILSIFNAPWTRLKALCYLLCSLLLIFMNLEFNKWVTEGQRRELTCLKSHISIAFKIFQGKSLFNEIPGPLLLTSFVGFGMSQTLT